MKSPTGKPIPHSGEKQAGESASVSSARPVVGDWGIQTRQGDAELQIADRTARDQAERFLRVLADGLPPHWLFEFRALSARSDLVLRRWFVLSAVTAAARWCRAQARAELDVYVGVQPRRVLAGGAAAVAALVALYADLDCGPGKQLADKASALCQLERIAGLGLRSAVLVDSGNGLHAYWPLREPLERDGRAAWQEAMRALAHALSADRSVTDLPRILRVPGTINWKDAANPKPVRLLDLELERRFTLLDFDDLLPVHQVEVVPRTTLVSTTAASARVVAAIRAAGWSVREKRDHSGHLIALVLEERCPLCPGSPHQVDAPRRGTAHITPGSGTLRCKRALCVAGALATGQTASGEARGLAFEEWARRLVPGVLAQTIRVVPALQHAPTHASFPRLPRLPRLPAPRRLR